MQNIDKKTVPGEILGVLYFLKFIYVLSFSRPNLYIFSHLSIGPKNVIFSNLIINSTGEGYMDVYPKSKFSSKSNLKFGATKLCMNVVLKTVSYTHLTLPTKA